MGDMRDDFDAAIDELDAGEGLEETPQVVETVDEVPADLGDEATDALEGEADDKPADDDKPAPKAAKDDKPAKDAEAAADATADKDSAKAPVDWSPKERESWSKIPRHLQEKILTREKEMAETIAGTGEARKLQNHFQQLSQAYAPVLAAEGVQHPMQAVESLFKTVAQLRMGSPVQKAEEVARLIQYYGIDINALDNVLVGQPVGDPQQNQLEQMLEQKLAPMNQFMNQIGQAQQTQQQQGHDQAIDEVKQFAEKAEFLDVLRNDMADIIDLAAKRGEQLDLQTAYKRACAGNSEISEILEKRASDARIMGNNNNLAAKRNAASSISGSQIGTGGGGGAMSLREQLMASVDEVEGR